MLRAFGTRSRSVGGGNGRRLVLILAVSAAVAAGAALAQGGRGDAGADSAGRADDIVTQDDIRSFAEALVGKPSTAPKAAPTPQELNEKAKGIAAIASEDGRSQVQLGAARQDAHGPVWVWPPAFGRKYLNGFALGFEPMRKIWQLNSANLLDDRRDHPLEHFLLNLPGVELLDDRRDRAVEHFLLSLPARQHLAVNGCQLTSHFID